MKDEGGRITADTLISSFIHSFWPDPGLARNTRRRCYRCSVPGLAGFTRLALCGARDLISQF
jgi:hypothetical protein